MSAKTHKKMLDGVPFAAWGGTVGPAQVGAGLSKGRFD